MVRKLFILIVLLPTLSFGASYYIDDNCGTPGSGTTPTCDGDADDAWDDLSDITGLSAGDFVYLRRGGEWRESLTISDSGTSGNVITFSSYGSGEKPIINGSDVLSNWTDEGGNLWYASFASTPDSVFFSEPGDVIVWGTKEPTKGAVNAEYDWWFDDPNNRVYVYSTSDPGTTYSAVDGSLRDGITVSGDYITIEKLEIKFLGDPGGAYSNGIEMEGTATEIIIQDNEIHHGGHREATERGDGVFLRSGTHIVRRNKIYEMGRHGIFSWVDTGDNLAGVTVEYNEVYNNYHSQIDFRTNTGCSGISSIVVRYNKLYETSDLVDLDGTGPGGIVFHGDSDCSFLTSKIYGNVISNLTGYGNIRLHDYNNGTKIYNNSIYSNNDASNESLIVIDATGNSAIDMRNNAAHNSTGYCLRIDGSASGFTINYNNWGTCAANGWRINGADYNWTNYTGLGWDANGKNDNPDFTDPTNHNLTLQSASPAINSGVAISGYNNRLYPNSTWPADVSVIEEDEIGAFGFILNKSKGVHLN